MNNIKAIVSVTSDWGIGYKGQLLVENKEDMRHFVRMTKHATVLMGKTTFESFPKGPLVNRRNIVLSFDKDYERAGFPKITTDEAGNTHTNYEVYSSIHEALAQVSKDEALWVIGGASTYRALLADCEEVIVTKHVCTRTADAYFPNLDEMDEWEIASTKEGGVTPEGVPYSFVTYRKRA